MLSDRKDKQRRKLSRLKISLENDRVSIHASHVSRSIGKVWPTDSVSTPLIRRNGIARGEDFPVNSFYGICRIFENGAATSISFPR